MSVRAAMEILLVEDNPADVRLTQEALKGAKVRANLRVVDNGEAALAFLQREGDYASAPRPDLIFLDLNMPRMDGRTVLRKIKNNPKLDCIPVIVLSSSDAEEDVVGSYKLHASCHVAKPPDIATFEQAMRAIREFWLNVASIPRHC